MCIAAPEGRLRGAGRMPTLDRMRGTFRVALSALALAAFAAFACRTSAPALAPLRQTSTSTSGGVPITTPPPVTLPAPSVPGEALPRPNIPTTPQVAETNSFLDGGSLLGVGGSGPSATPGTSTYAVPGSSAFDAGTFSNPLGTPGSTGVGAPGSTTGMSAPGAVPGAGVGGTASTPSFSPDGGL
jgi:hypothetical protein